MNNTFFDYYTRPNHVSLSDDLHETDPLGLAAFVCRNMALLDEIKPLQSMQEKGVTFTNCTFHPDDQLGLVVEEI